MITNLGNEGERDTVVGLLVSQLTATMEVQDLITGIVLKFLICKNPTIHVYNSSMSNIVANDLRS